MSAIKVEVLDAVVDGRGKGAVIEVEAKTAEHLANIGYVRVVDEKKTESSAKPKAETKADTQSPDADDKPAKSKRGK